MSPEAIALVGAILARGWLRLLAAEAEATAAAKSARTA